MLFTKNRKELHWQKIIHVRKLQFCTLLTIENNVAKTTPHDIHTYIGTLLSHIFACTKIGQQQKLTIFYTITRIHFFSHDNWQKLSLNEGCTAAKKLIFHLRYFFIRRWYLLYDKKYMNASYDKCEKYCEK